MSTFLTLLLCPLLIGGLGVGLGWPWIARRKFDPAEKLVAALSLGLTVVFLAGWAIYVFKLPGAAGAALPVLALGGLLARGRELRAAAAGADVRRLLLGQAVVMAWCLGWLATIATYSGGGWAGDWFEHWERTRFFLEHWPLETKFIAQYLLPARPPLVNVVTGVFLGFVPADFAHYQIVGTVLAAFAFLPVALLARRWGGSFAVPVVCALLLANPLFVQNATFAWTKLPAAFFILTGLWFFLRTLDPGAPAGAGVLCALALAAGTLAHYSAGPYVVMLVVGWLACGWSRRADPAWWRGTVVAAGAGAALLAVWFVWSVAAYGQAGTFLSNSSATAVAKQSGSQWVVVALNIFDTIVPPHLRPLDGALLAQTSPWGRWRDWAFVGYQVNLFGAFGSIASLALLREAWRAGNAAPATVRHAWTVFAVGVVLLGIGTHGDRDHWGLAHISLQPFVLLGLGFLAARWPHLGRGWRSALVAGAVADFSLGIALHFGVQSFAFDGLLRSDGISLASLNSYNAAAGMNLASKLHHGLSFVADVVPGPTWALLLAAALLGLLRLLRNGNSDPLAADFAAAPAHPADRAAADLRFRRLLAAVAAAAALAYLWFGWCVFPLSSWNEVRLAPAFALRHGLTVYAADGAGPLSTWIYGPLPLFLNLPATFAATAENAVLVAGAINLAILVAPLVVLSAAVPAGSARLGALALAILLLPPRSLAFQVADHTAIALGLLGCWLLARHATTTRRDVVLAAICGILAASAKQTAVVVLVGYGLMLFAQGQRRLIPLLLATSAGAGALVGAAAVAVFGWTELWFNLVSLPARLPWAEAAEKLGPRWPQVLAYVAVPLALLAAGWPARRRPDASLPAGRFARGAALLFLVLLPPGLLSFFKIGGDTNVLHGSFYVLPAAALLLFAPAAGRSPRLAAVAVAALIALRWPELADLPARPLTRSLTEAASLAQVAPGTAWFPNQPVTTFYSDGRLYHVEDGLATRHLAGSGIGPAAFRRHLPPRLATIVYPASHDRPFALQLLPEFKPAVRLPSWTLYQPAPPDGR